MSDDAERTLTPAVQMFRIQVGSVLQKHRLQHVLTQADLAEMVGLSLKYLGEIERGEANCSIDIIARIAHTLNLSSDELLRPAQEPLSEGVRQMLIGEVQTMRDRLASTLRWLHALDPALHPARPRKSERTPSELAALRAAKHRARPSRRADTT